MIRFILKSAFFLGVAAMLLPGSAQTGDAEPNKLDLFSTFAGAQAAIADLSGFCDRAPAACNAGGNLVRFAGERIGDGVAFAYNVATAGGAADSLSPGSGRQDTLVTGAVNRIPAPVHPRTPDAAGNFSMPGLTPPGRAQLATLPPAVVPGSDVRSHLPIPHPAPRS